MSDDLCMSPDVTFTDMTVLLRDWRNGDARALSRIVSTFQNEFLRMAGSRLRGQDDVSLSSGDVVNEALLRLMNSDTDWANRAHFFATVSLTMRSVLREHARAKQADKRNAGQRVEMTLSQVGGEADFTADLLTLDALFEQLGQHDPRALQVLDMTYFAGLSRPDIATVLGVSLPTVDRELRFARAWLATQLGRPTLEA
jgi:RNA polymerase sigma factor (TIGR02999 family)